MNDIRVSFYKVPHDENECAFWDLHAYHHYGDWSTYGCWRDTIEDDIVTCKCNHLTNFAILVVSMERSYMQTNIYVKICKIYMKRRERVEILCDIYHCVAMWKVLFKKNIH